MSGKLDVNGKKTRVRVKSRSSTDVTAMETELEVLAGQGRTDGERAAAGEEFMRFRHLYMRFLAEHKSKIDWEKINPPKANLVKAYDSLLPSDAVEDVAGLLSKLAVVKLNGGLGTTMGCVGPKSAIEVRDGMSFLDLTVTQLVTMNERFGADVPLVLMNSFNTHDETQKIVKRYSELPITIETFNQSRFPRIGRDTLLPVARTLHSDKTDWYPPGHGDLYESLHTSGVLDRLLAQGKEYIFVSNVDNLGATVDPAILHYMARTDPACEFVMEVTEKTRADVKGGTIIDYEGAPRLLEIAQCPADKVDEFKSITKFKIFNTNNLWVKAAAIKRVVEQQQLSLEVIVNHKQRADGVNVIQLETAVGSAIKHFAGAVGVNVPRSRFLPVKSTSDLLLVKSNLYTLGSGTLLRNPLRIYPTVPLVKLGADFRKVSSFLARFANMPHILELDHITVTGDVTFGKNVVLKGTVIIVANHGERIDIPDCAHLENKVVSGNLRILDH